MRIWLIAASVVLFVGSARTEQVQLALTALSTSRCKVVASTTTDDTGRKLPREQRQASTWRCDGYGGRYVFIAYGDQREGLAFGPANPLPSDYIWPGRFGSWGPSMEWRGIREASGKAGTTFAIAAYSWDVGPPNGGTPRDRGSELAVIRVDHNPAYTCILAWVDLIANPRAIVLAREFADREGPHKKCETSKEPVKLGRTAGDRAN